MAGLVQESDLGEVPLKVGFRLRGQHHGIWGKFGIPPERFPDLFTRALTVKGLDPRGIQFHTSWNMGPEAQVKMIERVGACVKTLPESSQRRLKFLDIGGGYWPERGEWLNPQNTISGKLLQILDPDFQFKPRHYYHPAKPLDHFAREISAALRSQGKPLSELEIFMEPGRWLSTPAMHVLIKVIDKKEATVVIADGGINLLGWERPLFEFIPLLNLTRPSLREFPVRIFGNLCTPLDIWGTTLFGEGVENGDILLVPDQGSYTYSLRQSFIKPIARVVRFDGTSLSEAQPEQTIFSGKSQLPSTCLLDHRHKPHEIHFHLPFQILLLSLGIHHAEPRVDLDPFLSAVALQRRFGHAPDQIRSHRCAPCEVRSIPAAVPYENDSALQGFHAAS